MAEMSNAAMKQLPSLRPLIILLVGLPLVDFILNALWQEGMIQSDSFLIGLMVGEIGFAIVLAGAMGRAWVLSLLLTSWLAVAVTLMSVVWENRHYREGLVDSALFTIATIPPIVFCGSLPFLLVRSISGYRLSHPKNRRFANAPRWKISSSPPPFLRPCWSLFPQRSKYPIVILTTSCH